MTDSSKKLKCHLAFELQNLLVFQKCSKILCIILQTKHWQTLTFLWCNTLSLSLFRYYIKGEHEGKSEVFVRNLPGVPDNIRLSSRGGYWVGISMTRTETTYLIEQYPRARNFLAKVTIDCLSQSTVIQCHLHSPNSFTSVSLYLNSEESVKSTSFWWYTYFFDPTPSTA